MRCPGGVQAVSNRCLGSIQGCPAIIKRVSRRFQVGVQAVSKGCPVGIQGVSSWYPRGVQAVSRGVQVVSRGYLGESKRYPGRGFSDHRVSDGRWMCGEGQGSGMT